MRKRRYLFTGMAVVLLFTILFAAGYTTPALGNVNTVQAAAKKKDISREGKKKRSIIKGKIFELEVDKPESVKDKNLTWSIKDSSIVTFAGKERHDDDIKFKALKAGTTKITCRNTKTDKKISFNIVVKNVSKTKKASSLKKDALSWDTRTRTRNDRTRICSVTITPYPNISKRDILFSIASAKVLVFFEPTKFFGTFF